jgi:protocatechuate 3,4-dioxygenase beta subunit
VITSTAQTQLRLWLFVTLWLILIITQSSAQQPNSQSDEAKSGSITGRVINESGQPLAGATILIRQAGVLSFSRSTFSNGEGNFQVTGLDNGLYYVSANSPAYVAPPADPEAIPAVYRIGDSVRLELARGGVITGTVTNANSEPVVGVRVRALMVKDATGKVKKGTLAFLGERQTDDRGAYRIFGLTPGTYLIQAGGTGQQYSINATDFDAPTFAPSSTRDTASEIQVRGGEESTADIRYRSEQGHAVSGTVKLQGQLGASVVLAQMGDGNIFPSSNAYQMAGGTGFVFYGVADGDYIVSSQEVLSQSNNPDLAFSEPVRISVKGNDVTGIELSPRSLASISGRVALESLKLPECQNKRQPLFSEMMISLVQNRNDQEFDQLAMLRSFVGSPTPEKDGSFAVRNLRPGQYSLSPRFFARYWYVKSMTVTGGVTQPAIAKGPAPALKDVGKTWMVLKSAERLTGVTITLSEGAASIRGQVTKQEGAKIESGLRVYLVPSERDKVDDPFRYFVAEVDAEGAFAFANLPPGKYLALALRPPADVPVMTEKLRLPDAIDARAKIRKAAEGTKSEIELKPCQNLTDFSLR